MRTAIPALALAAIATLSACSGDARSQAMFRGNAAHTGATDAKAPRAFHRVKWAFATGGRIVSSPVIDQGTIYVGSDDGNLYAIAAADGRQRWQYKTAGPVPSTPAVAAGVVYVASYDGKIHAIDARSGLPRWKFATAGERRFEAKNLHGFLPKTQTIADPFDVYLSSPLVVDGRVFVGSGDGNVYALDATTGALAWKFATGDVVHASPAYADGTIVIGSWDSYLYALDAATGAQKWRFHGGEDPDIHNQVGFQSSPAVVDGMVYVGCRDAHVYALDAATGRKKWDYPTSKSWVNGTPAVRDGTVYVGTSDTSRFMALDARTGRLKFTYTAGAYIFSSAALAGDLAYFGSHNGRLYAVNAKTGDLAWQFQTEGAKRDSMKILNADGGLNREAMTPTFGDFQDMYVDFYRFVSVGAIMGSPAVEEGVVYVGSTDGNLYALK